MWRIDIWVRKKWKTHGQLDSFEEALLSVRGICQETHAVVRATLENPSPDEFCGIVAFPFRGTSWWTGSGGKV